MINSYTNVENGNVGITKSVVRQSKTSKFVRSLNIVLVSAIVLGSLILGGLSASNNASGLTRAYTAITTSTTK